MSATYPKYTDQEIIELALLVKGYLDSTRQMVSKLSDTYSAIGFDLPQLIQSGLALAVPALQDPESPIPAVVKDHMLPFIDASLKSKRLDLFDFSMEFIARITPLLPNKQTLEQMVLASGMVTQQSLLDSFFASYDELEQSLQAFAALPKTIAAVLESKEALSPETGQAYMSFMYGQFAHLMRFGLAYSKIMLPYDASNPNPSQQMLSQLLDVVGVSKSEVLEQFYAGVASMREFFGLQTVQANIAAQETLLAAIENKQHLLRPAEEYAKQLGIWMDKFGSSEFQQKLLGMGAPLKGASAPHLKRNFGSLYPVIKDFGTVYSDAEHVLRVDAGQEAILAAVAKKTGLSTECCQGLFNLRQVFKRPLFMVALRCQPNASNENLEMAFICYHLLKSHPALQDASNEAIQAKVRETVRDLFGADENLGTVSARERLEMLKVMCSTSGLGHFAPELLQTISAALESLSRLDKVVEIVARNLDNNPGGMKALSDHAVAIRATRPVAPVITERPAAAEGVTVVGDRSSSQPASHDIRSADEQKSGRPKSQVS